MTFGQEANDDSSAVAHFFVYVYVSVLACKNKKEQKQDVYL